MMIIKRYNNINLYLNKLNNITKNFTRTKQINFYEVLKIDKFSSIDKVIKAYNEISKNHSQEDVEVMHMVNLAYETLSDKVNKEMYDNYMLNDRAFDNWEYKDGIYCGESSRIDYKRKHWKDSIYNNKTNNNYNNQQTYNRNNLFKGSDIEYTLNISNLEAIRGNNKKEILINNIRCYTCTTCLGFKTKTKNKYNVKKCLYCNNFSNNYKQKCTKCNNTGYIIKDKCNTCNGKGLTINESFTEKIEIPPNVNNNDIIILKHKGNIYPDLDDFENKHLFGDLIIKIKVECSIDNNINKVFNCNTNDYSNYNFYKDSNNNLVSFITIHLSNIFNINEINNNINYKIVTFKEGIINYKINQNDLINQKIVFKGYGFKKEININNIDNNDNDNNCNNNNNNKFKYNYGDQIVYINFNYNNFNLLDNETLNDFKFILDKM